MRSHRSLHPVFLALIVLLAGCSGAPTTPPAEPSTRTNTESTTQSSTASPTTSPTTTPTYGPSLRLEAIVNDLAVSIRIYNSAFVSDDPILNETYRLDSGESVYLTNHLHGLDAVRVVLTVNDTEVWNSSLDLDAGYTVEVNESETTVTKTIA